MIRLLSGLLVVSYVFALIMSAGHLAEWYRLTLGSLPPWFATGLATALEASAFLLSLLSNSILKASRWAAWGAVVALALVWVGNFMSMLRAGAGIPAYEVFLSSLFVPVSTFVVAKVLGELMQTPAVNWSRVDRFDVLLSRKHEVQPRKPSQPVNYPQPTTSKPAQEPQPTTSKPGQEPQPATSEPAQELPPNGKRKGEYLELLRTPRTVRDLVEELGVSKTAVYKTLRALETKGLVENREGAWVARGQAAQQNPPPPG